jgi:hypothetical protein
LALDQELLGAGYQEVVGLETGKIEVVAPGIQKAVKKAGEKSTADNLKNYARKIWEWVTTK